MTVIAFDTTTETLAVAAARGGDCSEAASA